MRAVVVDGRGGLEVRDLPVPTPGVGEVLIRPSATGVCGTDLRLIEGSYAHGRYPVVPGHEFAGDVVGVGSGVSGVAEGDFVGIDPNISCGACRWCALGAINLCVSLEAVGISVDGSCAEYVVVPASVVHRLSDDLDPLAGALVEPLSCVLHAVERAPGWESDRMVVFGAGPIGALTVAVARHLGATSIEVVEPHAGRRERVRGFGADRAVASVSELGADGLVDLAVDASGHPAAIQSAVDLLGVRGRLVQVGVAHADARVSLSPLEVYAKELTIVGSNSLAGRYSAAAELMVDLADVLRPLVTDVLTLEEYAEAVRRAGSSDSLKVQVVPGD